jgi:hypothetical protein
MTATEQSSGPMSVAQAAERFESLLEPEKATPEAKEDETTPQPETEEELEPATEQEDAGDGESEDAEGTDKDVKQPVLHTVKVDGKEIQVPFDELVKGYQREADYTRKTMSLAEQRKAAESDHLAVRSEREHYASTLETLQKQIQQNEPKIDWARLEAENPTEWTRQRLLALDRQTAVQNIEAERQRVAALQQAEEDKGIQARVADESTKLMAAIPEWKDEAKATAEKSELVKFAATIGYTSDEISQVLDHRAIVLLRKAYQFDQLSQKRATLKAEPVVTPKPAKPGPPAQSQVSQLTREKQRLAKTGKVADAAAIFERLL